MLKPIGQCLTLILRHTAEGGENLSPICTVTPSGDGVVRTLRSRVECCGRIGQCSHFALVIDPMKGSSCVCLSGQKMIPLLAKFEHCYTHR